MEAALLEQLLRLQLRRFLEHAAEDEASKTEGEIAQSVLVELQQTEDGIQRLVQSVAEGVFTSAEARTVNLGLLEKKQRLDARLRKLQARASVRDELYDAIERVEANLPARLHELDGPRFRRLASLVSDHLTVIGEGASRARTGIVRTPKVRDEFTEVLRSTSECYVEA